MKSNAVCIAAMALLVVSAACGTNRFPVGTYVPAQPAPDDRVTEFSFSADGTFMSAYYDGKKATGTYTVSGDKITMTELNTDSPCLGAPATMTWTANRNNLKFAFVEDQCNAGLSYDWVREWAKKPSPITPLRQRSLDTVREVLAYE